MEEEQFDVIFPNYIFGLEVVWRAYSILFYWGKLLCDFIEKFNMTFWNYIFYGWKESIHSLWKKIIWWCFKIFSWLHRKHSILMKKIAWYIFNAWKESIWILHEEAYMMFWIVPWLERNYFSLQTLMGKQQGTVEAPNLRAIISCMDPKFHSCFLNWKWQNTHLLDTHLWMSLLGGLLHLLLNSRRDFTCRCKIPCTLKA